MHVAINAHLLSKDSGYRKAGIHGYIAGLVDRLPVAATDAHFTLMLNHHLANAPPNVNQRIGFDTTRPLRRIIWEQIVQPFALRQIQPDVYHATAFIMPRFVPSPSVVTVYDLSFERYPEVLSRLRRHYLRQFTRESCQRATRIIAISESTAEDMVELWRIPRDKIDVSLVGVAPEFRVLPADEIAQFRAKKDLPPRFLFFLGTLEPRKNLPMLLRAYAQLSADVRQSMPLVLAGGKGWMFEDIFATIQQYRLEETVHFPGYIPAKELVLWYNAADAFVYPALYEGFGLPILEAMACGKLVLASNSSSLPEAVGDTGTLLPPDDEPAWTTAMRAVYDQYPHLPLKNALQHAARFTWDDVAAKTLESYRQALK